MLTTALTPTRAAAVVAPAIVVEMAVMLAAGRVTTSGVVDAGGGGAAAEFTCVGQPSAVSTLRGRHPCCVCQSASPCNMEAGPTCSACKQVVAWACDIRRIIGVLQLPKFMIAHCRTQRRGF